MKRPKRDAGWLPWYQYALHLEAQLAKPAAPMTVHRCNVAAANAVLMANLLPEDDDEAT